MKTTTVPAQVTTVEDKIAGSLSMSQLLLLATPIFLSGLIYIIFPPNMKFTAFKLVLSGILFLICLALAVRVKGVIVLSWLFVILRYNLRPRYYLFDKNDSYQREATETIEQENTKQTKEVKKAEIKTQPNLDLPKRVKLEQVISNPRAKLQFITNRKGGLNVHITEVKQEG